MMFYSLTLTCVSVLYFYIYTHTHTKPCAICIPRDTEMQRSGVRIKHFQNLLYWVFLFAQVSCDTLFYNLLHRKIFSNSVFCGMVKIHLLFFIKIVLIAVHWGKKTTKAQRIELKSKIVVSEQETQGFGPWLGSIWSPLSNLLDNLSNQHPTGYMRQIQIGKKILK